MALTEAEKAELFDNQFCFDGPGVVRHAPCDTGPIYLGEPENVQAALAHLPECRNPDGPADTYRGNRPWPKGAPAQEAKKEEWLRLIKDHPETTERHYKVAVSVLVDPDVPPVDQEAASHLEKLGFGHIQPDGLFVAIVPLWRV